MARSGQLCLFAAVVAFLATVVYRFTLLSGHLGGFENDEFLVISRAAAILKGDWPSRDFVDPGYPLAYVASAVALSAADSTLLGHAVLTVTMLALGAALTAVIGIRASGSLLVGLLIAFVQIALGPRLYNYPKIVLYAAAVLGWWSYVERPTMAKLIALGVLTVVAFLFRHDHGAYIGLGTVVMLVVLAVEAGVLSTVTRVAVYGATCALCVTPYLLYLQRHGGVLDHLRAGAEFSRVDRDRTQLRRPGFDIDWDAALVTFSDPEPLPPRPTLWDETTRAVPIFHARLAPGILRRVNAVPFMYYLWLTIPAAAALMLVAGVRRWRDAGAWRDVARYAPLVVIGVMLNVWFLRGTLPVRLADVSVLTGALGAWLVARTLGRDLWTSGVIRAVYAVMLALVLGLTAASAAAVGQMDTNVRQITEGEGVNGFVRRAGNVVRELALPGPAAAMRRSTDSSIMAVADYLHACLGPDDRALVTGYRPEVFYFADRRFAAGLPEVRAGYLSREEDQRQAVERMRAQSAPVVITEPVAEFNERYRPESPILLAYLDEAYRSVGERTFAGGTFQVLIRSDRHAVRTHPTYNLPCFQ